MNEETVSAILLLVIIFIGYQGYRLFVPSKGKIKNIRNEIWRRHTGDDFPQSLRDPQQNAGAPFQCYSVLDYFHKVVDRQLNKARGILSSNSLIIAGLGLSIKDCKQCLILFDGHYSIFIYVTAACLLVSTSLCLILFVVVFDDEDIYSSFAAEIQNYANTVGTRAGLLYLSVYLSFVSITLWMLWIMFFRPG
jgi:hypothetical protein